MSDQKATGGLHVLGGSTTRRRETELQPPQQTRKTSPCSVEVFVQVDLEVVVRCTTVHLGGSRPPVRHLEHPVDVVPLRLAHEECGV